MQRLDFVNFERLQCNGLALHLGSAYTSALFTQKLSFGETSIFTLCFGETPIRISKSKSGFVRGAQLFLVVYKNDQGEYCDPIPLLKRDVIEIARQYKANQTGCPKKRVNESAAAFITRKVEARGWLALTETELSAQRKKGRVVPVEPLPLPLDPELPKKRSRRSASHDQAKPKAAISELDAIAQEIDIPMRTQKPEQKPEQKSEQKPKQKPKRKSDRKTKSFDKKPTEGSSLIETEISEPTSSLDTKIASPSVVPKEPRPAKKFSTKPEPPYRFLPRLDARRPPKITDDLLDDLAFVLSGVDPKKRQDITIIASGWGLKDLVLDSKSNYSSGSNLLSDHQYVLVNYHQIDASSFAEKWTLAQERMRGQRAADLVKLVHGLERFEIDPDGNALTDSKNFHQIEIFTSHSMEILARQYRSSRRKISDLNRPKDKRRTPERHPAVWLKRLGLAGNQSRFEVDTEVRKVTRRYLDLCVKLGRLLRSEASQRHSEVNHSIENI